MKEKQMNLDSINGINYIDSKYTTSVTYKLIILRKSRNHYSLLNLQVIQVQLSRKIAPSSVLLSLQISSRPLAQVNKMKRTSVNYDSNNLLNPKTQLLVAKQGTIQEVHKMSHVLHKK